jgi:hypothetical protein
MAISMSLTACQNVTALRPKTSGMVAFQSHRRMADRINSPPTEAITAMTIAMRGASPLLRHS